MVSGARKLLDLVTSAHADERGMMLIEVLVSSVVMIGMGLATFAVVDSAGSTSALNRARAVSVLLAKNDQDQMRQLPYQQVLTRSPDPRQVTVDGKAYTVTSTLELVDDNVGTSDCSSTSRAAKYLKMTSTVSVPWTDLQPVVLETLRAPTLGTADLGSVAVRLTNGAGGGTVGVPVIAGPSSGATNTLGCAFIEDVPEGAVSVSWSKSGYVNENGLTDVTGSVAVRADLTATVTGSYDLAGQADIAFTDHRVADPATIVAADRVSWRSVSAVNQGITSVPVGERRFALATPGTTMAADTLFPFANDYGFYAGGCDGNNPELYVDGSGVSKRILPGANSAVAVELPTISLTVRSGATPRSGYGVYATPNTTPIAPNPASTMEGCTEVISRATGSAGTVPAPTSATGTTKLTLPYGIWNICIDNGNVGSPRKYVGRFNNTPVGTPSPLAPTMISGQRAVDLDWATVSTSSGLCA